MGRSHGHFLSPCSSAFAPAAMGYHCKPCNRWFTSYECRCQHEQKSSRHRTYVCDDCRISFKSEDDLIDHYIESADYAYCHLCDELFGDPIGLDNHMDYEHYDCQKCCEVGGRRSNVRSEVVLTGNTHIGLPVVHRPGRTQSPATSVMRELRPLLRQQAKPRHAFPDVCSTQRTGPQVSGKALPQVLRILRRHGAALRVGPVQCGITRPKVNALAVHYDRNNIITDPSRLICGPNQTEVIGV